jgi:predicted DNA-binding transcriptional regulator AlpA
MYLSVKDVAVRYNVNPSTIWRWLKNGHLPEPKRFGPQTLRWAIPDLEVWEEPFVSSPPSGVQAAEGPRLHAAPSGLATPVPASAAADAAPEAGFLQEISQ